MLRNILFWVAAAGAAGGLANSLISGTGLALPRILTVAGETVILPGFVGNVLIGAVAAFLSFALYGPPAGYMLVGDKPDTLSAPVPAKSLLTLGAFAGAMLVGFSGGRWVTAEADKRLNHGTALSAAELAHDAEMRTTGAPSHPGARTAAGLAQTIRSAPPIEAYDQSQEALRKATTTPPTPAP
jgi:hypothetical protein